MNMPQICCRLKWLEKSVLGPKQCADQKKLNHEEPRMLPPRFVSSPIGNSKPVKVWKVAPTFSAFGFLYGRLASWLQVPSFTTSHCRAVGRLPPVWWGKMMEPVFSGFLIPPSHVTGLSDWFVIPRRTSSMQKLLTLWIQDTIKPKALLQKNKWHNIFLSVFGLDLC